MVDHSNNPSATEPADHARSASTRRGVLITTLALFGMVIALYVGFFIIMSMQSGA